LGLGFLYFIGLGWLIMELLFHQDSICGHENILLLRKIPLGITLGLIANYGVSLLFQSLSTGLTIGATISIVGIWRFLSSCLRSIKCNKESSNKWVGIIFICLLYISPILLNPLYEWDARSIWFFHAKMISSAGSFGPSAGWQHPSVFFSHVDYPNLVPGMAAQATHILGYWNEYIPKISLVFMLVPAVMWLFNFACKSFSFVYLLLLFPFSLSGLIWNGYMDGYLSIYLLISMLLFGRYIQHNELIDLISGMICLILLLYLKNEGQLAVLVGTIALVFVDFLLKKDGHGGIKFCILNRRCALVGAIVLLPFVVWNIYKMNYGLSNDLQINTVQSVNRAIERLNDNAYSLIINNTYNQIESSLLLFGLLYFALIAQKQSVSKATIPALMVAAIYFIGMNVVYLLTPHDLKWHLNKSVDRTMLPVAGCIFVACYFILDVLEKNGQKTLGKIFKTNGFC
jgi:hypothetical protein